ncbi:MAG: sensor histidine kinase [Gammaproteobacteria bacterium]
MPRTSCASRTVRFRSVVQTASDAIVLAGKGGNIISWNRGAHEIFGYGEDEVLGQSVSLIIPERLQGAHTAGMARVSAGGNAHLIGKDLGLVGRRRDGSEFPVQLTLNMWRVGSETYYSGTMRDITMRKHAEEQMRASLAEKEILLKEIHHRVKNNMQVISSMLNLQMGRIQEPRTREMFRDAQNRIKSMALIHERLYQQHTLARVEFAAYLRQLVGHLLRSYRTSAVTLKFEADEVSLDIDTAVPCGLIVNELVANALKHAFADGRTGVLTVILRASEAGSEDGRARLIVADDGPGISAGFDLRKATSLGLQLVADLTEQIGGVIESSNDHGARWTLSFPASRPQRAPAANTSTLPDAA